MLAAPVERPSDRGKGPVLPPVRPVSANLDRWFPPCGPCGICGGPDKRHRLGDAIYGQWCAGDSTEVVARWLNLDRHAVIANNVEYELAVRAHRRRPFQEPL